jgi:hypothetical protein
MSKGKYKFLSNNRYWGFTDQEIKDVEECDELDKVLREYVILAIYKTIYNPESNHPSAIEVSEEVLKAGYKTAIGFRFVTLVCAQLTTLQREGLVKRWARITDRPRSRANSYEFQLSEKGHQHAFKLTGLKKELEALITPQILSIALYADKDPLHDALIDANASEELIELFNKYPNWIMDWILEKDNA